MSLLDDASLIVTPNGYKGGVTTGKLYSVKPTDASGDMVVSRATTATRVNSSNLIESVAINVPRLDYTNSTCPSILVEPTRTNEFFYSEEFDNAYWDKTNVTVTANTTTAPDGTTTADKFIPNTTNSTHHVRKLSLASNAYTFSVFAKAGGETTFSMWLVSASVRAEFNLSTGTITVNTATSAKIEPYPNGWYRCSVYSSTPGTTAHIYGRTGGVFVGDGINGIFLWGAQIEAGSTATSYIPTVAGTVTRNADVITRTGISSLIGQTEGTLFFESKGFSDGNTAFQFITLNDGTTDNQIGFNYTTGGIINGYVRVNLVTQNISSTVSKTLNSKIILKYNSSNVYTLFINGSLIGSATAASSFSSPLTTFKASQGNDASNYNGNIKSIVLYKTALDNDQCIDLTTP
jgi:hypothetical protein